MNATEQDPPDGLTPAQLFVRSILYHANGQLTRREIQQQTGLKKRTVLDALERLKRLGEVEQHGPHFADQKSKPRYSVVVQDSHGETD